ncbi:putative protein arginine N-methyltransferase 3 [Dichanthelium oligosanthes]|uniref:type I protein arginine methyltransferase n=1 Tax=Dichanthelium oligosanthes TaxID=888268 RepID=A0A1E5VM90_9POAL|nr:putative protein arginine N-methyltransferase 3 [Dichanthelium oligosanthes]
MELSGAGKDEAEERLRSDEEEEEEEEGEEGWADWCSDGDDAAGGLLCLFCSLQFDADSSLFEHCVAEHRFDFHRIVKELGLDFYGCIRLINFVRSKVAENKCCSCGQAFSSNTELCSHLHALENYQIEGKVPWEDDVYLKPFMEDDPLLHSLSMEDDEEEEEEEDCGTSMERGQCLAGNEVLPLGNKLSTLLEGNGSDISALLEQKCTIGSTQGDDRESLAHETNDSQQKVAHASVNAKAIKTVDDNYFGSYSSFGIHREMLGDQVRTDSYRDALLGNPSLLSGAAVLDVGCGTGILRYCMMQVAKNNGLLYDENVKAEQKRGAQVITVVHTKAEELNQKIQVPQNGFDVLVSEWMGYCLLYESMLSSVLYARDHFLKPGGAILPDTATIEKPVVLSTSPFSTPTHWSQTIFTFEEPIAMVKQESTLGSSALVGTDEYPATILRSRISIVRASEHRSIDISVETTAFSSDGRKRSWPVQIFNL